MNYLNFNALKKVLKINLRFIGCISYSVVIAQGPVSQRFVRATNSLDL